jgi:hypothetical protein
VWDCTCFSTISSFTGFIVWNITLGSTSTFTNPTTSGSVSLPLLRIFWVVADSTVPTPWAALAFHPLDGYAQSLPYQYVFIITFCLTSTNDQRIRVHLPNAQTTLPLPLCHGSDLDHFHPRRRHDFRFMVGEIHQFTSAPHTTPPLLYLQLRPILHMGGFVLRLVPFTRRRSGSSTCCYCRHAEERIGG